jgi:stearoyl-CoA desaturase (Delta-9 desaturase)
MVGDRPDLLHFEGAVVARHRLELENPPEQVLRNEQRLAARVVNRAAEELAAHFNSERIALAITSALHGTELSALRERLARAHDRAAEILATLHVSQMPSLPHMPTREDISAAAKAMFARTPSLDEIADRAYELLLASVGRCLTASIEHHHR